MATCTAGGSLSQIDEKRLDTTWAATLGAYAIALRLIVNVCTTFRRLLNGT